LGGFQIKNQHGHKLNYKMYITPKRKL